MGKKSRAKSANQGLSRKAAAEANKQKELYKLVVELQEKCNKPPEPGTLDWNEYVSMHDILQRIMALQKGTQQTKKGRREEHFASFMNWVEANGVDTSNVEIVEEGPGDYGLRAKEDIEDNALFLSIPKKLMMTTDTACDTHGLGTLAKEDQVLRNMPNVLLALHLLGERSNSKSFWKPYIRILPTEYTTVLYYSVDDMALLKGSPAQYDAVMLFRNIARQYGYFYKLFSVFSSTAEAFLSGDFTYEDYRWAVSAVMTRQNQIPSGDTTNKPPVNALIPLWDMANHTQGTITTDYNLDTQCSECYALRAFKTGEPEELYILDLLKGGHKTISDLSDGGISVSSSILGHFIEQVRIFYGPRANAEFLVHSGFVYDDNLHDYLAIKLEEITAHDDDSSDDYHEWLLSLKKPEVLVSKKNEMKSWSFLETRSALLLRAYPTTLEEDEKRILDPNTSAQACVASHLLVLEKRILINAAEYAAAKKQELAEILPSQAEEKMDPLTPERTFETTDENEI